MAEYTDDDVMRARATLDRMETDRRGRAFQLIALTQAFADHRAELTAGQGAQFRARLECTQDPCAYCARPATAFGVNHPDGPFASEELARAYGQGMASNVYGASVHRVLIERRTVGAWERVES